MIRKVCVYLASSEQVECKYHEAAAELGKLLASKGITIVYGGSSIGSMARLADAALSAGGKVIGIMPQFLCNLEIAHNHLTELVIVKDMHERKTKMIQGADALVALPGGCGTLEELLEAITWKRLGLFTKPIIIVNQDGFYDPLLQLLNRMISDKFMRQLHRNMWTVVRSHNEVLAAINNSPVWEQHARNLAAVK